MLNGNATGGNVLQAAYDSSAFGLTQSPSASSYVETGRPVSFCPVVEAARRRGEVAISYRCMAGSSDPSATFGVRLNPDKLREAAFIPAD